MDTSALSSLSIRSLISHKITKNTAYQLGGKFFTALSGLLTTHLVAQYYGVTAMGDITLIFTVVNALYLFIDFGINAVVVKQMVTTPDEEEQLFRSLLGLRLVISLLIAIGTIVLVQFLPYDEAHSTGFSPVFKSGVILLSATFFMQAVYLSCSAVFQKRFQYHIANIALSIGALMTLAAFTAFTLYNIPFSVALIAYVLGSATTALISSLYIRYDFIGLVNPIFTAASFKRLLLPALPLALMLFLNIVYFRADAFVLARLKPLNEVGIYGLAYRIFEQALVIPIFFVNALYPVLLEQLEYSVYKLRKTLIVSMTILFTGGLLTGVAIYLLAPFGIHLISSLDVYRASILPLRILGLGLPLFFLSNLFLWLLIGLGKRYLLILIYGFVMLFNIVGNLLFIPHYSYLASAVLTIVSEALTLLLTASFGIYYLKKRLQTA